LRLSVRYMRRRLKPQELEFNVGGVGAVLGFGYRFR
jgi:hypothetical protein